MTYLTSGPIMTTPERRQALICSMADYLIGSTIPDRLDSIRILCNAGFSIMEVHVLIDYVRAVAFQRIVAREMSDGEKSDV